MLRKIVFQFLMLSSFLSHAQRPEIAGQLDKLYPKPLPTSPNVAALGRFGEYEVGYFTGSPQISVPLYEAKSGSLKIPITLNYSAGGVRIGDQASWVGLGWSLSTGGQISRSVAGKADEKYFYNNPLKIGPDVCYEYSYYQQAYDGISDTQADWFSYNFPGKGGKFLLGPAVGANPHDTYLVPFEPILIQETVNASGYTLDRFEITDEAGVKYVFGTDGANSAIDNSLTERTTWHLLKMSAANSDDQIDIQYQSLGTSSYNDLTQSIVVIDRINGYPGNESGDNGRPTPGIQPPSFNYISGSSTSMAPAHLYFDGGRIDFVVSGPGDLRHDQLNLASLQSIKVYSIHGTSEKLIKQFDFVFSYFQDAAHTIDMRLKLDALVERDGAGQIVGKYQFNYFTDTFSWNSSLTLSRDYWGYYNGAANNNESEHTNTLVPPTVINDYQPVITDPAMSTLTFGGDRNTNPIFLKEGVLSEIIYPTGGRTEFDYEAHSYNEGGIRYAGGLRVTKIESFTEIGTATLRTFKYGAGQSGFGSKNFDLSRQYWYQEQTVLDEIGAQTTNGGYRNRLYFSTSTMDVNSLEGVSVVYQNVREYIGTEQINNGWIDYEYDNGTYINDLPLTIPAQFGTKGYRNSLSWKRGKLTSKKTYDTNGTLVADATTTYSEYKGESRLISQGIAKWRNLTSESISTGCKADGSGTASTETLSFLPIAYIYQASGAVRVTSSSESQRMGASFFSTAWGQTYDTDKLTVLEASTNDGRDEIKTVNRYPYQLVEGVAVLGDDAMAWKKLNDQHIYTPVEQYSIRQGASGNRVIGAQLTQYKVNVGNPNLVHPSQQKILKAGEGVTLASFQPATINGSGSIVSDGRYETRITLDAYDAQGNLLQATKTNDSPTSYIWGYDGTTPVVEANNARNDKVTTVTKTTGQQAITMSGQSGATSAVNFFVAYAGDVVLRLGVAGTPVFTTQIGYSGIASQSGSVTLAKNGCGQTIATFSNVPAGSYTLNLQITTPDGGSSLLGACGDVTYPQIEYGTTNGITEIYFEDFEQGDAGGVATPLIAHTGLSYYPGDFSVNFVLPNSRSYLVEYWYYDDTMGSWIFKSSAYTGATVLADGIAIDGVRVHPADSPVVTYTVDPLVGITSLSDMNSLPVYYVYDSSGRLTLQIDSKGNIVKRYQYNYSNK
jgi:hypothetical protein